MQRKIGSLKAVVLVGQKTPNTACTRTVGILRGFSSLHLAPDVGDRESGSGLDFIGDREKQEPQEAI